jgi:hypothetical protein
MFNSRANKEESLDPTKCKENLSLAKQKTDELCRFSYQMTLFGTGGVPFMYWYDVCENATRKYIELFQECERSSLKKK